MAEPISNPQFARVTHAPACCKPVADRNGDYPDLLDAIQQQRKAYMHQVHLLDKERRKLEHAAVDSFVTNLLIDGAEFVARAELAWLDHVMHKVRERFATPS